MEMMIISYIASLFVFVVLPAEVYSGGYILSLDDNVDGSFTFVKSRSGFQDLQPVKVFQYVYEHKLTHHCIKVINFNLIETEDPIDFIIVSCDVKGPFRMEKDNSMINVEGIAYVGVKKGHAIWAVYIMPTGKCVQRLYTDQNWNFLERVGEMDLTTEQCTRVIDKGLPLKPIGPKIDGSKITQDKLPPIGQSTAKIVAHDLENFKRDESKLDDIEADGQFAKLTVYSVKKDQTGECGRCVSINSITTEDFLDSVVVSCDDESNKLAIAEDMIQFSGLVYVRDHPDDPIWAVFAEGKHCILKVYTDKERTKLQPKNQNKLEWDDCLELLNNKNIDGHWSTEAIIEELEVSAPRTYEEVLKILQTDVVESSSSGESLPVYAQLVKPEGEGYQAVPQPTPLVPLGRQAFEDGEKESSTTTTTTNSGDLQGQDIPQKSQSGGKFGVNKFRKTFSNNYDLMKQSFGIDPVTAINSQQAVGKMRQTFSNNVDLVKEKVMREDSATVQSSEQDPDKLSASFVNDYGLVRKKVDGGGSTSGQSSDQASKPSEEKSQEKETQ